MNTKVDIAVDESSSDHISIVLTFDDRQYTITIPNEIMNDDDYDLEGYIEKQIQEQREQYEKAI